MVGNGRQTRQLANLSVLVTANCPFSVALEYASEFMIRARSTASDRRLRFRGTLKLLALTCHEELSFELLDDHSERGRAHKAVRFRLHGCSWIVPDVHGAIRFRIAGAKTRILINGIYDEPLSAVGRMVTTTVGRRIAQTALESIADRLVEHLETSHRLWLKTISIVGLHSALPIISVVRQSEPLRATSDGIKR